MPAPLDLSSNQYPYKYLQVTLRRGMVGLPEKTREYLRELGMERRH